MAMAFLFHRVFTVVVLMISIFTSLISIIDAVLVSEDIGKVSGACSELGTSLLHSQQNKSPPDITHNQLSLFDISSSLPSLKLERYDNEKLSSENSHIIDIKNELINIFKSNPVQTISDEITQQINDLYSRTIENKIGFESFFIALGRAMETHMGFTKNTNEKDFTFVTSKSRRVCLDDMFDIFVFICTVYDDC